MSAPKAATLVPAAMKAVTGGRGALVDVGGPGLERHGADLEQQAHRRARPVPISSMLELPTSLRTASLIAENSIEPA